MAHREEVDNYLVWEHEQKERAQELFEDTEMEEYKETYCIKVEGILTEMSPEKLAKHCQQKYNKCILTLLHDNDSDLKFDVICPFSKNCEDITAEDWLSVMEIR